MAKQVKEIITINPITLQEIKVKQYAVQDPNSLKESEDSAKMTDEEKMQAVKRYCYSNLTNKGLFVFHLYREDVIQDVCLEIIQDREKFDKTKSVGIYCSKAYQFALTKQTYYTAKKRRDFFTADSLDRELGNADGGKSVTVGELTPAPHDYSIDQLFLLDQIQREFGETIYTLTKKILDYDEVKKEDLQMLRKTKGLAEMIRSAM